MKFLKQDDYMEYVVIKPSKYLKISIQIFSNFFFTEDFFKVKRSETSFQVPFPVDFFGKNISFVILSN